MTTEPSGNSSGLRRFLPRIGSPGYHILLATVAIFILGPLGGISAAFMNFSIGFFVGGQVLAGILGSTVTLPYGPEGKHGANYIQTMAASVAGMCGMAVLMQAMVWMGLPEPPFWHLTLYYLCIGMLMASGLFVVMRYLFNVPIAGGVGGLMLATFLYVFALLSLGLLISTKAQNQIQALQMTMIFILPSVFFSGFIFPRETMPAIFYAIGAALPATYYIELERAIVLRGANLHDFWFNVVILGVMGLFLFSLCAARFKQKIA